MEPRPPHDLPRSLTREELMRYARHLALPEVGETGQLRLRDASVALVGAGGLGSPLALYLAAAGVGRIGLVEFDMVDLSNLQRQILYGSDQIGHKKIEAARHRLEALNPAIRIETHPVRLDPQNALDVLRGYDVVADGADNFATRYLVNDACLCLGKPDVQGSVLRFEGHLSVFCAPNGPCYRCLFPEPPPPELTPSCAEAGVLGVLPAVIGSLQATEVLKLLLGLGSPLIGRFLIYDALRVAFREVAVERDPECPACGPRARAAGCDVRPLGERTASCPSPAPPFDPLRLEVTPEEALDRQGRGEAICWLDVREPFEARICAIEGSTLVPIRDLPRHVETLPADRPIVAYCHVGVRSASAVRYLRGHGRAAWSLAGGIDAWARRIDPEMPTY
jgi:adenylyltransferase/sulfurtransferase